MAEILVVDDNILIHKVFEELNQNYKLNFDYAQDFNSAFDLISSKEYNLVFLDIKLNNESGLDLIEPIQNKNNLTKIIIISGHDDYKYFSKSTKLGAHNFISKPINFEILENILQEFTTSGNCISELELSKECKFILNINKLLNSKLLFNEILEKTLDLMLDYIKYDFGVFYEPDFVMKRVSIVISHKIPYYLNEEFVNNQKSLLSKLLRICQSESLELGAENELVNLSKSKTSHMILPVIRNNNLLGIFILGSITKYGSFDLQMRNLFTSISENFAVAYEKESLLKKLTNELEEKKLLEQQLIESGKMAAIGELAAGISHEINNPLGIIAAFAQLLLRKEYIYEKDKLLLEKIVSEAMKASEIIHKVLNYSRKKPKYENISIHQVIKNTLSLINDYYDNLGIKIKFEFGVKNDFVFGNIVDFQEIILNLLANAKDAIQTNGLIVIGTAKKEIKGISYINIWIQDNGFGMDQSVINHIFEPFYTTKEIGSGTGLGLSLVLKIVDSYHGIIKVNSQKNKGTRFDLYFKIKEKEGD